MCTILYIIHFNIFCSTIPFFEFRVYNSCINFHSFQEYEKFMHFIDEEQQKVKLRELEKEILAKMKERQDYQAYYYRPMVNKYLRIEKKISEEMRDRVGDDYKD